MKLYSVCTSQGGFESIGAEYTLYYTEHTVYGVQLNNMVKTSQGSSVRTFTHLVYYTIVVCIHTLYTSHYNCCVHYTSQQHLVESLAGPLVSITIKLTPLLNHHFGFGPWICFFHFHISKLMMRVKLSTDILDF